MLDSTAANNAANCFREIYHTLLPLVHQGIYKKILNDKVSLRDLQKTLQIGFVKGFIKSIVRNKIVSYTGGFL